MAAAQALWVQERAGGLVFVVRVGRLAGGRAERSNTVVINVGAGVCRLPHGGVNSRVIRITGC